MPYDYNDIVRRFFEELKPLFINTLCNNFHIDYDDAMDIYAQVWLDVRSNILDGRVREGTAWKAYIIKMGLNQANKVASKKNRQVSIDDDVDKRFNRGSFELEKAAQELEYKSVYENPELKAVLGAELSYIPDPCNKILKLYYFDDLSMKEIADSMNYSGSRSAISTMSRCMKKLKKRVLFMVSHLGILD